jgi:hypothetical protein
MLLWPPVGYDTVMPANTAAFDEAAAFETSPKGYVATTTTFDAYVAVGADTLSVTVEVPTLDAAVAGESVPAVVEDGWFETFERRIDEMGDITTGEVTAREVVRHSDTVVIDVTLAARTGHETEDALAVINFVEGTWVGGIIPGYEYEERIQAIREAASQAGGSDDTSLS